MFREDKFLPNSNSDINSLAQKEAGFEQEDKNESEKISNEIVEFVIDNYLDEEGNFDCWESFGEKKIEDGEDLMTTTEKILNEEKVVFDDFEYNPFETFMFQEKTFQKIFNQYKEEQNLLRKIKIIKLFSDLSLEFARNTQGESDSYKFFKKFKEIINNPQESYLIRTYAKISYFENLNYYSIDNSVDDEEFEESLNISDMHDDRFDDINFSFGKEAVKKFINNREGKHSYGDINLFNPLPYSKEERALSTEYDSRFPDKKIDYEYFVRELAPGMAGAYTDNGELIGWQEYNKESFNKEDNKLNLENPAKILENLEISNKDEIIFFKMMSNLKFCKQIKEDFGADINNFNLRVQFQFLNFIKKANIEKTERVMNFFDGVESSLEKNNRIESFLSLEFDQGNGEKILDIGEKMEKEDAQKVFAKIAELGDLAQEKDEELAKTIFKDDKKEISSSVRVELLRKAHNIISQFSDELGDGKETDQEKIIKLLGDLENSRIEIDLVASLLIAGKKEGEVQNLENIRGVEIQEVDAKELFENKEMEKKLTNMYRANNSHKSKEDLERLMRDFEEHKKYDPRFHLVYFNKDENKTDENSLEDLVGFMRSSRLNGQKELPEGERYLGATNINSLLRKFYFGENFLREVVEKELDGGAEKIIAHVPENGPTHKVGKTLGFEKVAEEGEYRDDEGKVLAKRIKVELKK